MKLYAYNNSSASAKALANALGIKRVKHEGKALKTDVLINWGSSNITRKFALIEKTLNYPGYVANAINKLTTLSLLSQAGVVAPSFTQERQEAVEWLAEGSVVVARLVLNGHSGEGIEIVENELALPDAPLYTKYIKKAEEYRIHVGSGNVIFQQRKARKKEVPDEKVNWQVRNLAGGFIFANDGVDAGQAVCKEAIAAVVALGLDFGAVDIIVGKDGRAYVLEVNTACGLMGKTLDAYVNYFKQFGV